MVIRWGSISLVLLGKTDGVKNDPYPIEWQACGNGFFSSSTHAEMNTIVSHLRHKKKHLGRRKSHRPKHKYCKFPRTLFVVSIYKGRLRYSRPCNECIKIMRMYKIKRVIYSTGILEEPYYMENVATMPFLGSSRGNC